MALRFRLYGTKSVKSNFCYIVQHKSKKLRPQRCRITDTTEEVNHYPTRHWYKIFQSSMNNKTILRPPRRQSSCMNSKCDGTSSNGWWLHCKSYLKTALFGISGFSIFLHSYKDIRENFPNNFLPQVHAGSRVQNNFIADVVDKTGPALVFIEIYGERPGSKKLKILSNGSGFIVRKEGLILTNAHVVANKSSVSVKIFNGKRYEGRVIAIDPITDLAAVKINVPSYVKLTPVPFASSSDVEPGEWVIAMGSPLALNNTVTCGIISGVGRGSKELGLRNKEMDYIQTDAIINFGNSGGPLIDLDGHAVGVNTMKVTTGISFAIPSDYAHTFLLKAESMINKGVSDKGLLQRRYIGITMLTLTKSVMRDLKSSVKRSKFPDVDGGVFVYNVIPGTPAYEGGMLDGDIIIEINDEKVESAADVYDKVEKLQLMRVTVVRDTDKHKLLLNTKNIGVE